MKTRGLFFLFAFALLLPATSSAQVGSLLKNKMNKVVNSGVKTVDKEVDASIDTAVNKEADKANTKAQERSEQKKQNNNQPSADGSTGDEAGASGGAGMLGNMFSNKVDIKYKEDYSFSSRLYMVTETYDKKDVMKMDLYMFYSANNPSVAVETKSMTSAEGESVPIVAVMIVDGENKCFLMLTDMNGMKMGMISEVPDENTATTDKKGKKDNPPVFTKTGNTRIVAGYKCDEYSYVDPDDNSKGKVWFTKDARLKVDKNGWKNTGMSAYYSNPDFNDGIILANEAYDDKGKLTMKSETQEINENYPHSISVKGYSLRQMNMGKEKK
ncbi:MAG TPA: hypothetical protein VMV47_05270 [Bacteroidales bacterium]|nr:hypothetical protein [Bacteroidales bacterium]